MGLHISSPEMQDFDREFQAKKVDPKGNMASLLACCSLSYTTWEKNSAIGETADLVNLLVGLNEGDAAVGAGRFSSVVVLGDSKDAFLSAPLAALLRDEPSRGDGTSPGIRDLFRSCQSTCRGAMETKQDLIAGKVLELAFLWALACRAALTGGLIFAGLPGASFSFRCKEIEASRIFDKTNASLNKTSIQELRDGVLYYANECKDSHPSADIWFRSAKGEVVLVAVGGGGRLGSRQGGAVQKVCQMNEILVQNGPREDLVGVVLLPDIATELRTTLRDTAIDEETRGVRLTIVTGAQAQRLLGGLAQLLTWLRFDGD